MSSLFKGLAEYAGNHTPIFAPQQSVVSSLYLAQVLDVVTGEEIQELILSNNTGENSPIDYHKYAGAIRVKVQELDKHRYEDSALRIAYPIDRGNYRLPLVGELVLIVVAYTMLNGVGVRDLFYTNIVGGITQGSRHAIKPNAITPEGNITKPLYEGADIGGGLFSAIGALSNTLGGTSNDTLKRFENKYHHEVGTITGTEFSVPTMREGDHIIEGRFGGTIRFTGTSAWNPTPYNSHLLKGSKDGDPLVIIKVPPLSSADAETTPSQQEAQATTPTKKDDNINDDLASLYLTTTQNIPIELKTSQNLYTWAYDIETEPDTLLGKVDLTTTTVQATIADAYDPNDVISITATGLLNIPAQLPPGTSPAATTGNVVATGEYQAILVAGLDNPAEGYKPLDEQVSILQATFSGRIKGFRYSAPDREILEFLKTTPKIHVFLFSAGCRKAEVISKSPDVILDKIYIIEPWAVGGNSSVAQAVANGVPARHVFVGPNAQTGKGVVQGAIDSRSAPFNATDHWGALRNGGKYIGT
jgi:hypothetical protein